jgi:flagellar biosynthetic protein FliR
MTEAWILSFIVILIRVATFCFFVPVWSTIKPPRLVKLGLVLALTSFWFSALSDPLPSTVAWATGDLHWIFLAALAVREVLLGSLLALAFHVFLAPMQIAGSFIGQEMGLNIATLADPVSGENSNVVGKFLELIAVILFFLLDIHHYLVYCLHASFNCFPAGETFGLASLPVLIHGFSQLTEDGILICAPVVMVTFVALIALLVLARAVPSLNLFSIGMPLRVLVGLVALAVFMPALVVALKSQFASGIELVEQALIAK